MEKQKEGILEKHGMVEMEKEREMERIVEDEEMKEEKGTTIMGKVTEGMMEVEGQGVVEEERKRVVEEVGLKVKEGMAKEGECTVLDSVPPTVQSSTPEHLDIQLVHGAKKMTSFYYVPHEDYIQIMKEQELEERVKKLQEAGVSRSRRRILKGIKKATEAGGGEGIREQEEKEAVRSRGPGGRIYEICATIYEVVDNKEGMEEEGAKQCRELMEVAGVGSMLLRIRREQEKELEKGQKKEQEKEQIQKEQEQEQVNKQKQNQENEHDQEQAQDQENQKHVHSIIESVESLLIIDDDKAFNQNDADLMEMPEGLKPAREIELCQDSPYYLKEIALNPEQEQPQKKQGGRNKEDAKVRQWEKGEGASSEGKEAKESGAGLEETELTLAPSWKGESSCTKCNLFPSLINTEVWRKDWPR